MAFLEGYEVAETSATRRNALPTKAPGEWEVFDGGAVDFDV